VHSYFSSSSPNKSAPAEITRELIEIDLAKRFYWTPQEIAKIPYVWIQKFYLIEKVKEEAVEVRKYMQSSAKSSSQSGQKRKILKNSNVVESN
jgi:hypothetical protein